MPWEGLKGDGGVKECCVAASEPSSPCQLAEGETGFPVDERKELISRVEDVLVSITWTHKIHEKQAEICSSHATKLNVASIAATALTGSGALGLFASDDFVLKLATALLAFVSLLLCMLTMAFDFPGEAASHRHAAKNVLALREEGRDLLSELKGERVSSESARACYDMLRGKYSIACSLAPQTGAAAVERAATALKEGESTVTQCEREQMAG